MAKKSIKTIKILLNAFKQGATGVAACKQAGISTVILWRWCRDWPNLAKRIEQMKDARTPLVIDSLFAQAVGGNVQAQKFYLINRAGWKASEGTTVKVDVPVEVNTNTKVTIPVASPEEAEKVAAYAQLIRSHNLVSRTLGPEGHQPDAGNGPQGQRGEADPAGADTPGDTVAH